MDHNIKWKLHFGPTKNRKNRKFHERTTERQTDIPSNVKELPGHVSSISSLHPHYEAIRENSDTMNSSKEDDTLVKQNSI
jgi:hypothetical protein